MQQDRSYVKAAEEEKGDLQLVLHSCDTAAAARKAVVSRARFSDAAPMSVEFIAATHVRDVSARVHAARQRAADRCGPAPAPADADYWERFFEANAAEVLSVLPAVQLASGCVVRYRFFGAQGRDLRVRPFVARRDTDVGSVRRLLDWHPAPDSIASVVTAYPTQDVELLYSRFSYLPTAVGAFEYWLAMQELWASQRWTHSHLIASAEELSQITAAEGWQVVHPIEAYEPALVRSAGSARLAVLLHCPLGRFQITLQQVDVAADHSLHFAEPIVVATGPRGYLV